MTNHNSTMRTRGERVIPVNVIFFSECGNVFVKFDQFEVHEAKDTLYF